jgi:predicted RNA-binding Zn-ribbon protein involved in translation (DUF1610 family)
MSWNKTIKVIRTFNFGLWAKAALKPCSRETKRRKRRDKKHTLALPAAEYDLLEHHFAPAGYQTLRALITASGQAKQALQALLQTLHHEERDENGNLLSASLLIPITSEKKQQDAQKLLEKPINQILDKGAKEAARPRYSNLSYHFTGFCEHEGQLCIRAETYRRFSWLGADNQTYSDGETLDAKLGLQILLYSWVGFSLDWSAVPTLARAGVCQIAAQDYNSYLELLADGKKVSWASLEERDPELRVQTWRRSLLNLLLDLRPLATATLRDLYPADYDEDDPRGDRLVIIDPDFVNVARSPSAKRQAVNFVSSDSLILYYWPRDGRTYLALPAFQGVAATSPLGQIAHQSTPNPFWWHPYATEFLPVPLWPGKKLKAKPTHLLVPVEMRPPRRLQEWLSGKDGRKANWTLITERTGNRERRKNQSRWTLHLCTSREVTVTLRPNYMGVHWGEDGLLYYTVLSPTGSLLHQGTLQGDLALRTGLAEQDKLMVEQAQQLWAWRTFGEKLERESVLISQNLIRLAAEHDANLSLEKVDWVDKSHGNRFANRRYSMWDYARTRKTIMYCGWERRVNNQDSPIHTVYEPRDFFLRFTCPHCGAIRTKGQTAENANTHYIGEQLHCRKCSFTGVLTGHDKSLLAAKIGLAAGQKLEAKAAEAQN